jgi:hypothetical protein
MLFVLMDRDVAAPQTIRFWIHERIRLGKNSPHDNQICEAERCAHAMGRPPDWESRQLEEEPPRPPPEDDFSVSEHRRCLDQMTAAVVELSALVGQLRGMLLAKGSR